MLLRSAAWLIFALILTACDVPNADITGRVTFDEVSHNPETNGLDYSTVKLSPVRGVLVELIENDQVVDSQTTGENGEYKFVIKMDKRVQLRVRSELSDAIGAVKVVDNTQQKAVYVLQTPEFKVNKETMSRNLHAGSGWTSSGYTGVRAAAPFHILDLVYQIHRKLEAVDPNINLPELSINWSVNNIPDDGDESTGQIITSFYRNGEIFLLGAEDIDTDEYDGHVIIHEWGHFFEDQLSRSDSIGGRHGAGDLLDMRVAFGEGFGNAWAAIISDDPIYRDSLNTDQASGFAFNVEANDVDNPGWYSEGSVQAFLYDIYDANNDGADTISMGLEPIYQAFINGQKNTEALTSIFTFTHYLFETYPEQTANFEALLTEQSINSIPDIWAGKETNDANTPNILPVYTEMFPLEKADLCTGISFGADGNKLSNHRFVRLNITNAGNYQLNVNPRDRIDVDVYAFYQGDLIAFNEDFGIAGFTLDLELDAGNTVIDTIAYTEDGTQVTTGCFSLELVPH